MQLSMTAAAQVLASLRIEVLSMAKYRLSATASISACNSQRRESARRGNSDYGSVDAQCDRYNSAHDCQHGRVDEHRELRCGGEALLKS